MTASQAFTDLLSNFSKCSPCFAPGYEGIEKMIYFLIIYIIQWSIKSRLKTTNNRETQKITGELIQAKQKQ